MQLICRSTLIPGSSIANISQEIESLVQMVDGAICNFIFPPLTPFLSDRKIERPNAPFSSFIYEIAETQSRVIERMLESLGLMQIMSTKEVESEYRLPNKNKGELHNFDDKQHLAGELVDIFQTEFTDDRVYRLGLCSLELYFTGMGADGNTICLRVPSWLLGRE